MVGAAALLAGCSSGGGQASGSFSEPSASAQPAPSVSVVPAPTASTASRPVPVPVGPTAATGRPAPLTPVIEQVWTTPRLPCDAGWCTLSPPVGTVTFHAAVSGATSVEFLLAPTGTQTADYATSIGLDPNERDGWTAQYTYADEPLLSHLTVVARGPGGRADKLSFNLYHPEPLGATVPGV
jgi:hypothetical protein